MAGRCARIEDPQKRWLDLAARAGHGLPYVLLITLPLSGWYAASRLARNGRDPKVSAPSG